MNKHENYAYLGRKLKTAWLHCDGEREAERSRVGIQWRLLEIWRIPEINWIKSYNSRKLKGKSLIKGH